MVSNVWNDASANFASTLDAMMRRRALAAQFQGQSAFGKSLGSLALVPGATAMPGGPEPVSGVGYHGRNKDLGTGMESLVPKIIQVESGGNPMAVSPKGAKGLMQIMPENYPGLGITDPFDPKQNVQGGTKLLNQLYAKYQDKAYALAAYNWNPAAVDRWIAAGADPAKLPKETRDYIGKILGGMPEGQRYAQGGGTGAGGQGGSLTLQSVLDAIKRSNPNISPMAMGEAVSAWLPLLNQQSQVDYKKYMESIYAGRLQQGDAKIAQADQRLAQGDTRLGQAQQKIDMLKATNDEKVRQFELKFAQAKTQAEKRNLLEQARTAAMMNHNLIIDQYLNSNEDSAAAIANEAQRYNDELARLRSMSDSLAGRPTTDTFDATVGPAGLKPNAPPPGVLPETEKTVNKAAKGDKLKVRKYNPLTGKIE
jgi:Transglycosylase SLT domain